MFERDLFGEFRDHLYISKTSAELTANITVIFANMVFVSKPQKLIPANINEFTVYMYPGCNTELLSASC